MNYIVWVEGLEVEYFDIGTSPYFPCGHEAFDKVTDLIKADKHESGFIDDNTRYVLVPKHEILTLVNSLYSTLGHLNKRLDTLYKAIEKLPDDKPYKLVQHELVN